MNNRSLTLFLPAFQRLNRRRVLFCLPLLAIVAGYFVLHPRGDAFCVFVPALLLGGYALLHHSHDQPRSGGVGEKLTPRPDPALLPLHCQSGTFALPKRYDCTTVAASAGLVN